MKREIDRYMRYTARLIEILSELDGEKGDRAIKIKSAQIVIGSLRRSLESISNRLSDELEKEFAKNVLYRAEKGAVAADK